MPGSLARPLAGIGAIVLVTIVGCSSGGSGASPSPDAAGSSSTFADSVVASIKAECDDPDAGVGTAIENGMFSQTDFCTLYLVTCGKMVPGYTDMASCEKSYEASAMLTSGDQRHCRSNHLCNAAVVFPAEFVMHCGHAVGVDLCN